MSGILDQIARSRAAFRVKSLDDVFAIELAKTLRDMDLLGLYLKLVPLYPHIVLADAAKRLREKDIKASPALDAFYHELTHVSFTGAGKAPEIIACKVERDRIGIAILIGSRLARSEVRHFRSTDDDANRSCAALLTETCEDYPEASVAIEVSPDIGTRRARLRSIAEESVRKAGLPIRTIALDDLFAAFAIPACKTRQEVRAIVESLYPQLDSTTMNGEIEADALAVGILARTRILLHTEDRKAAA